VIARLSLTARLGLLFMLALTGVLLAAGLAVNHLSREHFIELDSHALHEKLAASRRLLAGLPDAAALEARREALQTLLGAHQDLRAQLFAADGRLLFAQPADVAIPAVFREQRGALWDWQDGDRLLRGLTAALALEREPPLQLVLALDVTHHAEFFTVLERWLWLALGVCALLSAGLGWLVARGGLRPLREVARVAAQVSAPSLKARMPEQQLPRELRPLAAAFNDMLGRLDESFVRLSNFSADIAHELRTPLTRLMTHTEVVLGRARSLEDYREALYGNLEDLNRMARMIDDMLFLAKADNGLLVATRRRLALHELADRLLDYYQLLAEEGEIVLHREGEAWVEGDEGMLRRALSNLLSNALRHAPPGGVVRVRLVRDGERVRVEVENPGQPIPADARARLFDRFYRLDPARRESGHAGLGLAITRSILTAHQGRVRHEALANGNRFILELPAAD